MSKLPYMKFYPGDWLKDPALRACSEGARALWIDMLCMMWECPRRGYLKTGKEPWGVLEIANALHADPRAIQERISELKSRGVLRQTRVGVMYSKRITRDERQRKYWITKQKDHRSHRSNVKPMSTVSSEVRSQKSEVNRRPDDDPHTLLGELQASYPIETAHLEFAIQQVRQRAKRPPGSLAFWRKSLKEFFQNWELEVVAYERERAGAIEARAGQNLNGRTQ